MAKYLKHYNKETKKWELISAGETTVIQTFDSGTPIFDKNVSITSSDYTTNESGNTNLKDTLGVISDDIKRLQRNVSWLAEHGGGNSGGNGGNSSYGIVLVSPVIENNAVYVTEDSLAIKFRITGGTSSDTFRYRYTLDGINTSSYITLSNDELATISIASLSAISESSTHTVLIEALNPYGLNMSSLSFRIYESSLSLSIDKDKNNISNGEVLLSMNDITGYVYFKIKNGVERSTTTLHVECNDVASALTYENEVTSEVSVPFSLWSLIDKNTVVSNGLYTIGYYAQATLGTSVNNKTAMAYYGVRITNPNTMSIYLDGVSYVTESEEESDITSIEQNDKLTFTFKVYLPSNVSNNNIRYALWLLSPNGAKYYLFDTSDSDTTSASTTVQNYAEQSIPIQIPLSEYEVSDGWKVYVKAWSYNGSLTAQTVGQFNIIQSNSNIFPRQYPKRLVTSAYSADTCLFAWESSSKWVSADNSLRSLVSGYSPCVIDTQNINTEAYLAAYNTDGAKSGHITPTDGSPSYLRLQNESYAVADMTKYSEEINYMTNAANSGNGFTMSVTFKSDEHADADKTVFLWGSNNSDGSLFNGCKITLESVSWFVHSLDGKSSTLTASIKQGVKNTIDFVYNNGNCYIYVNGIINAAYNSGALNNESTYYYPSKAIFACDLINNVYCKYSDINLYECAFYTAPLNGLQIAVNGKNARLNGMISDESILLDYIEWKRKNLIYSEDTRPEKALSYLIDSNGDYKYDSGITATMRANSPIPSIFIDATNTQFTKSTFTAIYTDTSITARTYECKMEYYDPETKNSITFPILLSLQGTSTLGYRVKNLEIKVNEKCSSKGEEEKYKLFQPKETWFPEREFTLKADVVDSAHANNATIGYWINHECGIMEDNPAMKAMTDDYRPKDRALSGENHLHTDSRDGKNEINYDEKVTIKHTLEGFPVLVFIHFANSNSYDLIGIYSFNLGRYSYFNMGLSFLKEFSRRSPDNPSLEVGCPALVDHYVEYGRNESFNGIDLNGIYSYEFDATGDENFAEYPTWSQGDKTVIQHYGNFKFNGENPEISVASTSSIWDKLSDRLFKITATMGGTWLTLHNFGEKEIYRYNSATSKYESTGNRYAMTEDYMSTFDERLSIKNAVSYYVIAIALGMIDSLGKNLTLRTWNGGEKWWTAFYDMDSALKLTNEGKDDVSETINVDTYENRTAENGVTELVQNFFVSGSTFNAYNSKLWAILRSDQFKYQTNSASTYEDTWIQLRKTGGALSKSDKFVSLMEKQIGSCGELVYNYDYNQKYIEDKQNISMLHGLRIETVRKWLKNHFYYLDGVFETDDSSITDFEDAPYYKNSFNITNRGHNGSTMGYIPYTFRSVSPTFIRINTGNSAEGATKGKYFLPAYTETSIHTMEHSSQKQTIFSSSTLLTKIGGLDGIQPVNMNTNNSASNGVLPALTEINISGAQYLTNDPINFDIFKYEDKTALETIDLSNTSFSNATSAETKFEVDCQNLTKVKYIDISNSLVTSLVLPSSILQTLKIKNSNIVHFNMSNQPILNTIDFTGCNRLQNIKVENCKGLDVLSIGGESGLTNLNEIKIDNCANLTSIEIVNNSALKAISINNCNKLSYIKISNCTSNELSISILGCPLTSITMSKLEKMTQVVTLPTVDMLSGLTYLDISNTYNFGGLKYGSDSIMETVGDNYVLDLSSFPLLKDSSSLNLTNVSALYYIRFSNKEDDSFKIYNGLFNGVENLTRVYGHITLANNAIFYNKKNFYINSPIGKVDGITPLPSIDFNNSGNYTNIEIGTTDASLMFAGTSCSLGDVYYFLLKCDNTMVSLNGTFRDCANVTIDDGDMLNSIILNNCTGLKDIDYLFFNTGINGNIGNDFLSGLTGLTGFSNVFPTGKDIRITIDGSKRFFPSENKIANIDNFNPKGIDGGSFGDGYLLSYLPELKTINNSFNNCYINFSRDDELFTTNTKLTSVINSFNNVTVYDNKNDITIKDLFGSKSLSIVRDSFNFTNGGYGIKMGLGNSFFANVKETIKEISGSFINYGGLIKIVNYDDCNGENFPYEILNGCTKLEKLSNFFDGVSGNVETVVEFPKNMFETCISLKDFSNGFSNVNLPYILTSDGFKNNAIENFSNAFCDGNGQRQGMIPYHMFYQSVGNVITNMSSCFAAQSSSALTPYTLSGMTDDYIEENIYIPSENGNSWNEFFADGSSWFKAKAEAFKTNHTDLSLPDTFPSTFEPNGQEDMDPSDFDMGIENEGKVFTKLNTSNYFCPPDIFAYCKNDADTTIDNCFQGNARSTDNWLLKGFFGRIPSDIFKPLSSLVKVNGVFQSLHFTPNKWGVKNTTDYGEIVPSDLLSNLNAIQELKNLFAETNIWGRTILPKSLFSNNSSLRDITSLWSGAQWYGNVESPTTQIPNGLFMNCPSLIRIQSLLEYSNAVITSNLFTYLYNPKIYDVSGFLNNSQCSGTLIKWWNDWNIIYKDNCYTNINSANFDNYDTCKNEAPSYFV